MRNRSWCFAAVLGGLLAPAVVAQEEMERPERGVARISVIAGDVSVRRGDTNEWTAAAINAPVIVGDRIFTGTNSRAEVQFDAANMIRLGPNAEARMADLQYDRYVVQIAEGLTTWRVLRDRDADVEISTPSISVRPMRRGEYRVHVQPDGTTEVTVRGGEAEIFTPRGVETLRAGRTMLARGDAADPEFQTVGAIPRDDWDNWNERRDRELERARSPRYVSADIYGAEDLDGHGQWVDVAPYGHVWTPRVAVGWAPYRFGRWTWLDWYGWSWVSYDPWGWAPYHYGRWFWSNPYGWCWYPGGFGRRHFWSPALVGWVGWNNWGGFNAGIGFGFGRVGWIPLAPFEPLYPWWGRGFYGGFRNRGFVDNSVNIVNNVNVTNVYRNARVNNGVTVVNGDDFRNGRVRHIGDFDRGQLARASQVRGQVPAVPERASLRYADREVRRAAVDRGDNGRFVGRRSVEPVQRASFEDQRRGMQEVTRRAFGGDGERAAAAGGGRGADLGTRRAGATAGAEGRRGNEPGRSADAVGRGAAASGGRTADLGTRRADVAAGGEGRRGGDLSASGSRTAGSNSGWRRFGEPRAAESTSGRSAAQTGRSDSTVAPSRGAERGGARGAEAGGARGSATDGGWRRFGAPAARTESGLSTRGAERQSETWRSADPGRSTGRSADSASPGRTMDSNRGATPSGDAGWRRFGDSGRSAPAERDSSAAPGSTRGGRFDGSAGRTESPTLSSPRSTDRGVSGGSSRGGNSGRSLQVSPRIVEPRSGSRGSDAGSGRSMDRGSSRSSGSSFEWPQLGRVRR
jgi:hypothetical protein